MDNNEDKKIIDFFKKDNLIIPDEINKTFDNFIEKVRNDKVENTNVQQEKYEEQRKTNYLFRFRKLMAVAASFLIVIVASNAYAQTQGYDNIFFLIKDLVVPEEKVDEEIFSDRDIIISYKPIKITADIEIQINELQIKDNIAKLYLLVKEQNENNYSPLSYKIYNEENQIMYDEKSSKKDNEKIYTEVLELKKYKDDTNEIKMEVYDTNKTLLKTIIINLEKKSIEARTENQKVKRISQIELNKFLKEETQKAYTEKELSGKQIIIINTYDIYYSDGKYIVKYLYMMPTEEDFNKDKVEETQIYTSTIEFIATEKGFIQQKIEKGEIF